MIFEDYISNITCRILKVISALIYWNFVYDIVRSILVNLDVKLVDWGKFGPYSCCWIYPCSWPAYNIYNLQLKYWEMQVAERTNRSEATVGWKPRCLEWKPCLWMLLCGCYCLGVIAMPQVTSFRSVTCIACGCHISKIHSTLFHLVTSLRSVTRCH